MHDVQRASGAVALRVRGVERVRHLHADPGDVLGRDRLLLRAVTVEQRAHVLAVDVLHGEEVLVAVGTVVDGEFVDPRDVLVLQDGGDLGFVDAHAQKVVVGGEVVEHALDRHQVHAPLDVEGLGAEDLGHAAERDSIEEQISPELLRVRHGLEWPEAVDRIIR